MCVCVCVCVGGVMRVISQLPPSTKERKPQSLHSSPLGSAGTGQGRPCPGEHPSGPEGAPGHRGFILHRGVSRGGRESCEGQSGGGWVTGRRGLEPGQSAGQSWVSQTGRQSGGSCEHKGVLLWAPESRRPRRDRSYG